jgi:hypothetical protein
LGGKPGFPKISLLAESDYAAGPDHLRAVQSVFFAGGGSRKGNVVGTSDAMGGYPARDPQRPENLAATMYHDLGLPATAAGPDDVNLPNHISQGELIHELFAKGRRELSSDGSSPPNQRTGCGRTGREGR